MNMLILNIKKFYHKENLNNNSYLDFLITMLTIDQRLFFFKIYPSMKIAKRKSKIKHAIFICENTIIRNKTITVSKCYN